MAKKFYTCTNNGVTAVVSETVYEKIQDRLEWQRRAEEEGLDRPQLPNPRPVFTFTNLERLPHKNPWVTGDINLMASLLEGHNVERRSFYVPFSNGYEYGSHGEEVAEMERKFRTTLAEAMETFGLGRIE